MWVWRMHDYGADYLYFSSHVLHAITQGIGTKQVSIMVKVAKDEKWIVVCIPNVLPE